MANHKVQTALTDTGPVVSMNDSLFRYGSGILVVRHNKVVLVTKK
jgi:hypothetical protein